MINSTLQSNLFCLKTIKNYIPAFILKLFCEYLMLVMFSVASFQFSLSVISDSVKFVKNDSIQGVGSLEVI